MEGLFLTLPKLLDSSRDHTFIETVTVRHVYFSMVSLFLIVITNRFSTWGDSDALRLLVNEEIVLKHAADIDVASDDDIFLP